MTWLKLSDDFSDECDRARLSDTAFRVHVEGLGYVMRKETGGHIDRLGIRRAITIPEPAEAITELVTAGFWRGDGDGQWVIVHHMIYQPDPDELAADRAKAAERQRRSRRRRRGMTDSAQSSHTVTNAMTNSMSHAMTDGVSHTVSHGELRDGTGRDGTGNLNPHQREEQQHTHNPENTAWLQTARCETCGDPMDRKLASLGQRTHPACQPAP